MVSLKGLARAIKMGGHGVLVECGCVELAETNELGPISTLVQEVLGKYEVVF